MCPFADMMSRRYFGGVDEGEYRTKKEKKKEAHGRKCRQVVDHVVFGVP